MCWRPSFLSLLAWGVAAGSWTVKGESVTLVAMGDTGLQEFRPTTSSGTSTALRVGTVGASGEGARVRALFHFEPASIIPIGSTILSASLELTVSVTVDSASRVFELHRMLAPWDETNATWLIRLPPDVAWSEPGGVAGVDFAAATSAVATLGGAGTYTFGSTTGLVADAQRWLDNPSKNHGWMLLGSDEITDQTSRLIKSRENATDPPRLSIEFEPPFRIDSIVMATNHLCLAFQGAAGKSYVVERRMAGQGGEWTVVTNIPILTAPGTITVREPLESGNNFYRVGRE